MDRRLFLRDTCRACLLGTAGFALPQLIACAPARYSVYKATVSGKTVTVPLDRFAASELQIVRPEGWYRDIAVQKKTDGSFTALLLECTHQENNLTVTGNGFHCSLHGSDFDRDGRVRKGPAELPLTKYATSVENGSLLIHV